MKVAVKNGNVEKALRNLKRKMKDRLLEVKGRRRFTKPCQKRNEAKQAATVREKKRQKETM